MKNLFIIVSILLIMHNINMAQECIRRILDEGFTNISNYKSLGNGLVNISNGLCNFDNVANGTDTRVYKNLNSPLSNDYWKSECKYTIKRKNANGFGTGSIILAFTAGKLNFMNGVDQNGKLIETNQDGLAVTLISPSVSDNNINNWVFAIEDKNANVRNQSKRILANSSISDYYIRFERTSKGSAKLSIYSDPNFTNHITGSPIDYNIDQNIIELNTIQHGINQGGSSNRVVNANIDYVVVCQKLDECPSQVLDEEFTNLSNYVSLGNGLVNISNGLCNFDNVANGTDTRVYKNLSSPLSNDYWKSECKYTIKGKNANGFGTGSIILTLTAGNLNFMNGVDQNGNLIETNQDGLAVTLISPSVSDNNIDNWGFAIEDKNANIRNQSTRILANSSISDYYIRFERTSKGSAKLSIYRDPNFTNHLTGSPIDYNIDENITALNTIQHGINQGGSSNRVVNANIDYVVVCQDVIKSSIDKNEDVGSTFLIYPNPASNSIFLKSNSIYDKSDIIMSILDVNGRQLLQESINFQNEYEFDVSNYPSGLYFLRIKDENETFSYKFLIQR